MQLSDKISQHYSLTKETKWVLESFNGKSVQEAGFKERTPFIILDKQAGRISGHSGCNSFNGNAEIGDTSLKTGMLMSTKAFCMGVPEHELFKYFEDVDSYKINGNKLLLMKGEDVLLEFVISSSE
jgi:heat shock protein HslJ